jgi:hypothetical protein
MEPSTLTIRDLYPDLTPAELKDAEANLTAYLDLACRIYQRWQAEFKSGARSRIATGERSNLTNT